MQSLLLPTKIVFTPGDTPTRGELTVEPCEAGFGTTLGNALRRVLLSSLPGAAITDVKIKGVQHEFSTIPGVLEDMVTFLLNVKQVRLKVFSDDPVRLTLHAKGERAVTAGDIEKNASVEVVNPTLHLATLTTSDTEFSVEFVAQRGRGYDAIESRERRDAEVGLLALDALCTPIRNVGFRVDHVRVGQMTNFDRLTLMVETDGTISGQDAVQEAAKILIDHFSLLISLTNQSRAAEKKEEGVVSAETDVEMPTAFAEDEETKKGKKKKEE